MWTVPNWKCIIQKLNFAKLLSLFYVSLSWERKFERKKKHIILTPELRRCDQFDAFLRAAIATERSAIIQTFLQHFATVQGIQFDWIFFSLQITFIFFSKLCFKQRFFLGKDHHVFDNWSYCFIESYWSLTIPTNYVSSVKGQLISDKRNLTKMTIGRKDKS